MSPFRGSNTCQPCCRKDMTSSGFSVVCELSANFTLVLYFFPGVLSAWEELAESLESLLSTSSGESSAAPPWIAVR